MDVNILINAKINVNASIELLGDIETYNETLQDFLNEIDEKLANIEKYKNAQDMENYAILVHSLKSDSKYLGFTNLADLAYNHEMASKEKNVDYVNANYNFLINEANRILAVVKEYMKGKDTPEATQITVDPDSKKILLVDDSNIIINFTKKLFPNEYEIVVADDGEKALEIVKAEGPNIKGVLLDINMPKVNGFEVLDFFRDNGIFEYIPVTIITGDDSKTTIMKAFNYPIVDVLTKPFSESAVKNVIAKMVNFRK